MTPKFRWLKFDPLLVSLLAGSLAAGTLLAFGFQFALSVLPDLIWIGNGSPSILSLTVVPSLELWLALTLAGGLPSAFITYFMLKRRSTSMRRTFTAVLFSSWVIVPPAIVAFSLGHGFLWTEGAPLEVAVVSGIVAALVGSIAHLSAVRIAAGTRYFRSTTS